MTFSLSLIQLSTEQLLHATHSFRPWGRSSEQSRPQTPCPLGAYTLEGEIISNADIWEKKISGRENSKCKGPEAERAWHDLGTDTEPVAPEHREAGEPRTHRTRNHEKECGFYSKCKDIL